MGISATNNVSFQGHYCYIGADAKASRRAAALVREAGNEAVDGLRDFLKEHTFVRKLSYPGSFLERMKQQFKDPRWSVYDTIRVGVRPGRMATNGTDTLVISSGRDISGRCIPGATVEVPIQYPPQRAEVLKALQDGEKKALEAVDRNFNSLLITNPDMQITEDLTKVATK